MKPVRIAARKVGGDAASLIIAEAGVNHNGQVDLAFRLVEAAAAAGADAVKFQTFSADRLVTRHAAKAAYQVSCTTPDESQYEMLRQLELAPESFRLIAEHCTKNKILFLSSAFDEESVDLLDRLGVPAFKLGSGELTNLPLLSHIARKRKPMIVSTGMADLKEVRNAVNTIRRAGNSRIVLLHCVSAYPAAAADCNLRAMDTLQKAFDVPVGFSDHTRGVEVAIAAAARGAAVLEKHLTLHRNLPGPDHAASLEPHEFAAMVYAIREVQAALGDGRKARTKAEQSVAKAARRSIVAARDIPAGRVLTLADLTLRRPGTGLPPSEQKKLIGCRACRAIQAGKVMKRSWLK